MPADPVRVPSGLSLAWGGAALLARLRRHEGWTAPRIRAFQERELRRHVAHAVAHVPYYRDLFREHGLRAADIATLADLPRIPMLTRAHLRAYEQRLISEDAPRDS